MKEAVLILAHGSKREETEIILDSLVNKIKSMTGMDLVYPAYLQFSEQNLEKGINYLVKQGAEFIKVIPMFLFDGIHVTRDIPAELNEIRKTLPGIEIKMGRHIGDDDRIALIITDRANEIKL